MDSPLPTVALVVAYLYVVMFLGPRMMANKKPFKLNEILVIYNAIQVMFSVLMLWEVGDNSSPLRDISPTIVTKIRSKISSRGDLHR